MSDKFIPLECDDDIIKLSHDSFTVTRLRQLVLKAIREKSRVQTKYMSCSMDDCVAYLSSFKFYDENLDVTDLQLQMVKDCQILRIGGKGWETGKIKIKMSISPNKRYNDYVELEFCPDEPEKVESPLDDLRKELENI
jgi:hypothetical protein